MSRKDLADAFNLLAEAAVKVAIELEASDEQPSREAATAGGDVPPESPPAATSKPAPKPDESAFTLCPAHRREWSEGRFGKYCTSLSEDPDWSNDKGFCRITPRNAAAWLRDHPKVPA